MSTLPGQLANLFKLRIGITIAFTAVVGLMVTPGPAPSAWQVVALVFAVMGASASAGGFNQYIERDLDARMHRTRQRPFVTGALAPSHTWLWLIAVLQIVSVGLAAVVLNPVAALYVFLGAFFYAVVYTLWLKPRTSMNIVIGGLAGSFAVLAGAAAVDPGLSPLPLLLAAVLFLWTPSHFWSLAIALHEEYATAGVPMLPCVVGDRVTAWIILGNTLLLVAVSLLPVYYGLLGPIYLSGALIGGGWFLVRNLQLVRNPCPQLGRLNFYASLLHLSLVLMTAMVDMYWR
ncbi:Protoheme IX farnesyltransferase 2 [Gammaproteobacteria bacterium]